MKSIPRLDMTIVINKIIFFKINFILVRINDNFFLQINNGSIACTLVLLRVIDCTVRSIDN